LFLKIRQVKRRNREKSRNKSLSSHGAQSEQITKILYHKRHYSNDSSNCYKNGFSTQQTHEDFWNLNDYLQCKCQTFVTSSLSVTKFNEQLGYQKRIKSSRIHNSSNTTSSAYKDFDIDFRMFKKMQNRHADDLAKKQRVHTKNLCELRP